MTAKSKPIEKTPQVPVPRNWGLAQGGIPYRPRDRPHQEDWLSVARKFQVRVMDLIYFNFMTNNSDEVNYYLRWHVGCKKISPSGNNWMFSNDAVPGYIFIPRNPDKTISYEAERMCSWSPALEEKFIRSLLAIAQGMPSNNQGTRIKRLLQVILAAGPKGWRGLWYYNAMAITTFLSPVTDPKELRRASNGERFPLDGQSPWHTQSPTAAGGTEASQGMWRIHAIKKMFDDFCGNWDATAMKARLLAIDDEMYKGWYQFGQIGFRTQFGGGSTIPELVVELQNSVVSLSNDKTSLYWAFQQD